MGDCSLTSGGLIAAAYQRRRGRLDYDEVRTREAQQADERRLREHEAEELRRESVARAVGVQLHQAALVAHELGGPE